MADKEIVFIDDKGNEWTRENLLDLISGYSDFKSFLETMKHYNSRL